MPVSLTGSSVGRRLRRIAAFDAVKSKLLKRAKGFQRGALHALDGLKDPPVKRFGLGECVGRKWICVGTEQRRRHPV